MKKIIEGKLYNTTTATHQTTTNPRRSDMKQRIAFFIIGLSLLAVPACTTVHLTAEGYDRPVSMTSNVNKEFTIVRHFERDLKGWFTLFNLVTITDPDVQQAIQNEVLSAQGDAAINVKIKGQTTFMDGAIPVAAGVIGALITPGGFALAYLVGARTYTIEGDVIKYSE